jgi:HSP20 family protein
MATMTPQEKTSNRARSLAPAGEHPLSRLRDEFDALVNRFFSRWPAPYEPGRGLEHFWNLDVEDAEKAVVIRAEAPGFEPDDFDVRISGNLMMIRAEHRQEAEEQKEEYRERRYARFERSITLPASLAYDKAECRYHSGVLEISLPKTPEAQTKRIPVKV